jgi:hypothetical protein
MMRDHHPNPKHFCIRPEVHAKIPEDVDMSDWRCDDFPEIDNALVKGRAPKKPKHTEMKHTLLTKDPKVREHAGVDHDP